MVATGNRQNLLCSNDSDNSDNSAVGKTSDRSGASRVRWKNEAVSDGARGNGNHFSTRRARRVPAAAGVALSGWTGSHPV